ncbi:MAG: hypothetical protein IKU13_07830 [Clostridia bacterium]|nr:hypothetical protein [Clostridia bacterium]MBR5265604.1 hypothetical protein [Clostridia bacterium]
MREFVKKYDLGNWAVAIVAAFLLWMYAVSADDSNISHSYTVPLQVTGQNTLSATGLNIINTLPERVSIKVSGPRDKIYQLGDNKTTTDKISAKLDLSSIYEAGDYKLSYDVSFEVDSISVEQKSPAQISVSVDRIVTEKIPVEINFTGKLTEDFNLENYYLSVPEIEVRGPQRYVDEIAKAVVSIDRTNLHEDAEVQGDIVLYDAEGEKYVNEQVSQSHASTVFTATMHKTKTVELKINKLISNDIITDEMAKVTIAPQTIQIWGDTELVDSIEEIMLGDVSIAKCLETDTFDYVLPVKLPEGVMAEVTDLAATVKVELEGVEKISVHVPAEMLPAIEGYEIVNTEGIDVVMYAKTEDVANITVEELKLFPIYSQGDYDNDTLHQVDMKVVCIDYEVIFIGEYMVEVNKVIEE